MTTPAIRIQNISKCFQLVGGPLANANLTENVRRAAARTRDRPVTGSYNQVRSLAAGRRAQFQA